MGRPGLTAHPKFRQLALLLKDGLRARGALESLWDFCYTSLSEHLGGVPEIAWMLRIPDDEARPVVAALEATGFIERNPDCPDEYLIHDLWQHCPDYVLERCEAQGERLATRRENLAGGRKLPRTLGIPVRTSTTLRSEITPPVVRTSREKNTALRAASPVEKSKRTPKPLLRLAFDVRARLPFDASEGDLKEDLKCRCAQLGFDYGSDPQLINRVLEIVTHVKPLAASLPPRTRRKLG